MPPRTDLLDQQVQRIHCLEQQPPRAPAGGPCSKLYFSSSLGIFQFTPLNQCEHQEQKDLGLYIPVFLKPGSALPTRMGIKNSLCMAW